MTMKKLALQLMAVTTIVTLIGGCSSSPTAADIAIEHLDTGSLVEYHANGKVKREAEYTDGELVTLITYYASGTEASNEHYLLGELLAATYYFADGRVKTRISSN
jgi:hypothetical protein